MLSLRRPDPITPPLARLALLLCGATLLSTAATTLSAGAAEQPSEDIVMTTVFPKDETPLARLTYLIYQEAFRRIGRNLVYVYHPPLRGSVEADYGLVDGELGRGQDYGAVHPNLIRVDVPALFLTLSAYVANPAIHLGGWDSLRASGCRIEYRSGMQIPQSKLHPIVAPTRLSSVPTALQGLKKLAAGRTDVYIDFDGYIDGLLPSAAFTNNSIRRSAYIEQVAIHAYLHQRHAGLERRFTATLTRMARQGLLTRYAKQCGFTPTPARALQRTDGGRVTGCGATQAGGDF